MLALIEKGIPPFCMCNMEKALPWIAESIIITSVC